MAVRRESVVLTLDDRFTPGMAKAAAITAVLNRELNNLSGSAISADRSTQVFVRDLGSISREARGANQSINQLTGRLRVLGESLAVLGPGATPIGGAAIAGIAGFANQMGIAAVAGGVLIGSLQGVGDALGAMNKAQLEPTEKNLQAAKDALDALSPAAEEFARQAFALKPALLALRDIGAEALMPGLTESLNSLEELGPRVGGIMEAFGSILGDIAEDSTASLASDRWADFFAFIEVEGPATMSALAATVGDLTHGFSELWEAFAPLNSDFNGWLRGVAEGFDEWATGLSATQGFTEFIDYIRTTGPQVADTFGAIFDAVVQLVQATAPLGGPVLAGIEALANAFSAIADSDLGTPILAGVAALSLLNRSLAVTASLSKVSLGAGLFAGVGTIASGAKTGAGSIRGLSSDIGVLARNYKTAGAASERMAAQSKAAADNIKNTARAVGPTAGLLGGLAVASSGAADGIGLTNTASMALMGSLGGAPGIAIGAAAGLFLDWRAAADQADASLQAFQSTLQTLSLDQLNAGLSEATAMLSAVDSDGMAAGVLRSQIGLIEEQIGAIEEATAAQETQRRIAAMTYAEQVGLNRNAGKLARMSTEAIEAQAKALVEAREAAYETASSFVTLGDSLNDSKTSLGDWIAEMSNSADALINFTRNSRTAAKRGLNEGLIASLQDAGKEGALRMRQLANATEDEIERANAAWRKGKKAMQDYANFKVPPKRLEVDNRGAMNNIAALEARLRAVKDEDVFINVRQIGSTTLGPRNEAADGTFVPKTGKPYADRHLYLLADGEGVTTNRRGETDRFKDVISGINSGYSRSMVRGMLADGGVVGKKGDKRKFSGGEFVTDNTAALEQAIRSLTSVAEDQTRAVEDSTRKTDLWANKMSDVAQATVAGFSTALFETRDIAGSSNPWAAGAVGARTEGGWLENLTKDISGLQTRSGLQSQLAGMGLSGDALAALLSEGTNEDISGLINSGGVSQYASLYAQRSALQSSVGAAAGQQAFGRQHAESLAVQNRNAAAAEATQASMAQMQRQIERQAEALERIEQNAPERTGAAVGAAVNGPAKSAAIGGPTKPGKPK